MFNVCLLKDKNIGKCCGFGFVEMVEVDVDNVIN